MLVRAATGEWFDIDCCEVKYFWSHLQFKLDIDYKFYIYFTAQPIGSTGWSGNYRIYYAEFQ